MEDKIGTEKGIPFHKWNDQEIVKKQKSLLKEVFNKLASDPTISKGGKKFAKNVKRVVGL